MRALVELVRLPAALTVPGDPLAGAAAAGRAGGRRAAALPAASACLYWAGMALNDWADRELDATERPERPLPSGRVAPGTALALAGGLTAAGLGLAAWAGGRDALAVAVPLAGTVWAYDLLLKPTAAGPVAMGAARTLDVLLGAGAAGARAALPAALAVGAHTVGVTVLSRDEVHGSSGPLVPAAALATTGAVALAAAAGPARGGPRSRAAAAALATAYAATALPAQRAALREPTGPVVRRAVGAGLQALVPLQAALTARSGRYAAAVALLASAPVGRALVRRVAAT
ncbi:SCO3242 family prenyltransferase [Vallicoccus soli]|uniref:4-hydroxybenzoate polyprenyltransferase n=1 Tax=Vallicoccus soli TaxID=2339232 RepID=A0A3A3Z8Q9_9ACTN|nr:4-hydroxybenzoate polyprenyltransferase [Vallicoccus soli]